MRAVAVVSVILFHAGFTLFPGGYVGVDVFFVISGYLITTIIALELERSDFSIVRFYERRARRILPALFLVVACCIPFAWMWMEPVQFRDFGKSVVAVVLFVSNFLFWQEEGYFAPAADEKPLLHTWSLAVEEQFYLVFPLLMLLLWRLGKPRLLMVIGAIAASSIVLSEIAWRHAPGANFYLAPTRVWELAAGTFCAFAGGTRLAAISPRAQGLLAATGLAFILLAVFLYTSQTPIPSLYALLPVGGTCLVILFANRENLCGKLLSTAPFVGVGLISYSAYLWHQPLFAFARIRWLAEPGAAVMLALCGLSFVLAWFSWRYVEMPFRVRRQAAFLTRRQIFASAAALSLILVAAGSLADNTSAYLARLPQKAVYYASYIDYGDSQEHGRQTRQECFLSDNRNSLELFDRDKCLAISPGKQNILLIGDSHAAHLSLAIREAYPDINLLQATSSGCRPFLDAKGEARCTGLLNFMFRDFIPNHRLDAIIWSGRWSKGDRKDMDETLAWLSKHAPRVIVIGPTMAYKDYLAFILRDAARFGEADMSAMASRYIDPSRYPANDTAREIAKIHGAQYVDLIEALCPQGKCRVISNTGEPMGFDRAHLTLSGSRTLMEVLVRSGAFNLDRPKAGTLAGKSRALH